MLRTFDSLNRGFLLGSVHEHRAETHSLFVAVAEDLHFGKAAIAWHFPASIEPTDLALEREIGARLFERSNRRVELTARGSCF